MSNSTRNPKLRKKFDEAVRLNKAGRADEAAKILRSLRKEFPRSASVVGFLGGIYFDQDRFDEAIACFGRATELSPMSELASLGLFHSLWAAGRKREALGEMGRFLASAESSEYRTLIKELHLVPTVKVRERPAALAS